MTAGDQADEVFDLAVVGGGPVGLHAALKGALLYHTVVLFDKGKRTSRAYFVPNYDNIPGHPEGISGRDLLERGRAHIARIHERYGREWVTFQDGWEVTALRRPANEGDPWELTARPTKGTDAEARTWRAKAVVLATGVVDRQPIIGEYRTRDIETILPYANKGTVDYCLLCDGHTVEGKTIAVLGCDASAASIAKDLLYHFKAKRVTIVTAHQNLPPSAGNGPECLDPTALAERMQKHGIDVVSTKIKTLHGLKEHYLGIEFEDGARREFDKGWVSLGWYRVNNQLAQQVGAQIDPDGYVRTGEDCEALDQNGEPIHGLFIVGDLRAETWKQVVIGWGDAETAVVHAFAEHL
ncbi:MAG TPA: NAD(P)/FAD-dependent oxidoreductase [Candidatus Thermoplasmatota archaeon]|nr:NAD(P)/FAD-dependent oxidoreductase [Candidatus Thermoplasmatota archaeon]